MNTNQRKTDIGEKLKLVASIIGFAAFVLTLVLGLYSEDKTKKKYGETQYEFVVTDKYDDLRSNWHLIGGRATEQEYHIVYKYRLTNRPSSKTNMIWYTSKPPLN